MIVTLKTEINLHVAEEINMRKFLKGYAILASTIIISNCCPDAFGSMQSTVGLAKSVEVQALSTKVSEVTDQVETRSLGWKADFTWPDPAGQNGQMSLYEHCIELSRAIVNAFPYNIQLLNAVKWFNIRTGILRYGDVSAFETASGSGRGSGSGSGSGSVQSCPCCGSSGSVKKSLGEWDQYLSELKHRPDLVYKNFMEQISPCSDGFTSFSPCVFPHSGIKEIEQLRSGGFTTFDGVTYSQPLFRYHQTDKGSVSQTGYVIPSLIHREIYRLEAASPLLKAECLRYSGNFRPAEYQASEGCPFGLTWSCSMRSTGASKVREMVPELPKKEDVENIIRRFDSIKAHLEAFKLRQDVVTEKVLRSQMEAMDRQLYG